MADAQDLQNDIRTLAEQIRGIRVAMLTTEDADGVLRSRPMITQQAVFDGVLWFFTDEGTSKVTEIFHHRQVNLSYVSEDGKRYVSISGLADIVRDHKKAEELWNPVLKAWFPNGLETPRLVLMRIMVTEAEFWGSPGGSRRLMGLEALLTGERYTGEHGEIEFHPTD